MHGANGLAVPHELTVRSCLLCRLQGGENRRGGQLTYTSSANFKGIIQKYKAEFKLEVIKSFLADEGGANPGRFMTAMRPTACILALNALAQAHVVRQADNRHGKDNRLFEDWRTSRFRTRRTQARTLEAAIFEDCRLGRRGDAPAVCPACRG